MSRITVGPENDTPIGIHYEDHRRSLRGGIGGAHHGHRASAKPTIVLVPGAFRRASSFAAGAISSTGEKPMEFLVEFEVRVPDGAPASEVEVRKSAEASAAARLVDEGHLVRLWKPPAAPGETKVLGLYRADGEAQLAGLLGALPLYDWMNITVTPLEAHPNDPVPRPTVSAAAGSQQ